MPISKKFAPPFPRLTYTQAVEILTGQKTQEFLAKQLDEFKTQKAAMENQIAGLENQQADPKSKQWQKDKTAAQLIELARRP